MSADSLKHLNDHEKLANLSAGERAALRHMHKFVGLHYTDEKLLMSDDAFNALLAETRAHNVSSVPKKAESNITPKPTAPQTARVVKE